MSIDSLTSQTFVGRFHWIISDHDTVDGNQKSGINSPAEVGSLNPIFLIGFLNTSLVVVWDFRTINHTRPKGVLKAPPNFGGKVFQKIPACLHEQISKSGGSCQNTVTIMKVNGVPYVEMNRLFGVRWNQQKDWKRAKTMGKRKLHRGLLLESGLLGHFLCMKVFKNLSHAEKHNVLLKQSWRRDDFKKISYQGRLWTVY